MSPAAWSDDVLVRRPLEQLLWAWLEQGRQEVMAYLANNGHEPPDPAKVAQACPALGDRPEIAAWHLRVMGSQ